MAYALEFADTAVEDLEHLIDSLPSSRRERAIDAIEAACQAFADAPRHGFARGRQDPSFPIDFTIDGVVHRWVGLYHLSPDERTLSVEHIFRVPL